MAPQAGMQRRPSGRAGPVSTLLKGCSPPEQVTGPFAPARTGIIIHIGADRPRSGDSSSCSRGRFCRKGPCPNPAQKQVPPAPFHAISRVWGMPESLSPKGEFTLVYPMLARLYPSAEMWPSGRRRSPAKGVGPKGSRGFESHRLRHLTFFADLNRSPWAAFTLCFVGFFWSLRLCWICFDCPHIVLLGGMKCGMRDGFDGQADQEAG